MKTQNFIELPVTTWTGNRHVGVDTLFNMSEISRISKNGHRQTKIIFKNGNEEFIHMEYEDVVELLKYRFNKEIRKFKNIYTQEIFVGVQYDFRKKYNLCHASLSNVIHGKRKSINGWVLVN